MESEKTLAVWRSGCPRPCRGSPPAGPVIPSQRPSDHVKQLTPKSAAYQIPEVYSVRLLSWPYAFLGVFLDAHATVQAELTRRGPKHERKRLAGRSLQPRNGPFHPPIVTLSCEELLFILKDGGRPLPLSLALLASLSLNISVAPHSRLACEFGLL